MKSIKELKRVCQNPIDRHNPDSFIEEKIWRFFSIYITKLLLYTPLKPNHVTMFMIFWGFVVGFIFSIGTYWYMLLGAIAMEFLYIFDAVDGEMARYKKLSSLSGMFLDLIAHLTNTALPFVGMTIGLYSLNPGIGIVLIGLSASVFSILCLNIQPLKHHVIFKEILKNTGKIAPKKIGQQNTKTTLKSLGQALNYLYDQIYMIQIIFLGAIFNKLYWVLFFYGLTFPIWWLVKLVYEYKIGYKPYEYLLKPYKNK